MTEHKFPRKQSGFGLMGWLIVIIIVGGATSLGLQLVPVYMDNNSLNSAIEGIASEPDSSNMREKTLHDRVIQRLKLNGVRDFPVAERVKINRGKSVPVVVVDYEVRMPLFENLDLVASFNQEFPLN